MRRTRSETVALFAAAFAFPASALSISGTHLCLGLAFLACIPRLPAYAAEIQHAGRTAFQGTGSRTPQLIWLLGGLLFAWLALSTLVSGAALLLGWSVLSDSGDGQALTDMLRRAIRGELGDVALFLFGLLVFRLAARDSEAQRIFGRALNAAVILLVLSGVAALFTEFRLARWIPHLLREAFSSGAGSELIASAANRPQHPLFELAGVQLYKPIGFMNTRLTFAGLIVLSLPWAAGQALEALRERSRPRLLVWTAAVLAALGLLLANGTRSVQFGLMIAVGLGVLCAMLRAVDLSRPIELAGNTPPDSVLPNARTNSKRPAAAWLLLVLLPVLIFGGAMTALLSETGQLQLRRGLARVQRHTDFARPILWTQAADFSLGHPVFGVGPGNFERAGEAYRADFVQRYPHTWYFLKNTPRGHAHNDLLHLSAVGGLPAGAAYLLLLAAIVLFLIRLSARIHNDPHSRLALYAAAGTVALFFAGLAQCYFQDDEVIVLFWGLLGLASAYSTKATRT